MLLTTNRSAFVLSGFAQTMASRVSALLLVSLMLSSVMFYAPSERNELEKNNNFFEGFTIDNSIWNETPFREVAVPLGFNQSNAIDYSDVAVLINNKSDASKTIGWAFVSARNISSDRVFVFENTSTPTAETINRNQFNTYFADPFRTMLSEYNGTDINYLVTTKGVPLRVNGGNNKAAFDQEIALIGGTYDSDINQNWWANHAYGPLAGKQMEEFTRDEYGFFLVTRLTGYTVDTALGLIEKANNSYGSRGTHVLDLATNRNNSGYKFWNDDLYTANSTLNGTMNLPVYFDEETGFVTNVSNVIGYASWGSNDGNWNQNFMPNGGFDTADSAWSSGARYWNVTSPSVSSGDSFNWIRQGTKKQGGNSAMEAEINTVCTQESGYLKQGIYSEFFDNQGVSFNSATMPSLIDRVPDYVRLESTLGYSSSNNPYPGLDDRFKVDWGGRFSGLIDVPYSGNWTFYINSDDGSALWINQNLTVENAGMHGMVEKSSTIYLDAGYHDFRIEFFEGGGPHGLIFSWQGPNTSKAIVPASAFYVSGDYIPQESNLVHQWDFEEGTGTTTTDEITNDSNFTLYGMNSSNWKTCLDGNCLWYDGVNDYLKVDVNDWLGNFSVSQWVYANVSNQTNFAATFAIDDNAGSNYSFQHMVYNSEWRLHNNQSHVFGDVEAQVWTHLVSVFDGGYLRQYMDGVLVRETNFPNGSVNNFDLYKLGVNRAGNSFFEGMIDNLMIWDTALNNSSITSLRRNIITNCSPYSGTGTNAAYLEAEYQIPDDLKEHAWNIWVYGTRTGEVFAEYNVEVTSLENGTELFTNSSSNQDFTTSWGNRNMRFRPHENATSLKVRINLDIVPTSISGSLFIDTVILRAIRPHMDWVNGSIVETAVSTGARSFNWGTSYGQSLVADILEDGASGTKGYVYEPYLTAVSYPSVLLSTYASGYNLAESYAASNLMISWMGVVVGDPKMSAYADIVHDIEILDVRVNDNVSINQTFTVDIALQNVGPGMAEGNLKIIDKLGSIILHNKSMTMPSGSENGSRQIISIEINSSRAGWNNLAIRWDASSPLHPERNLQMNKFDTTIWVNSPPEVDDIYCDSNQYSRGDRFECGVVTDDDSGVMSAQIGWRVTYENVSSNWTWQNTGSQDGITWWTTIELPVDIELGVLDIAVSVTDMSNLTTNASEEEIAYITNAPAFWYGIHISTVDSADWDGATILTSQPNNGIKRGHILTLKACVLDADHEIASGTPIFLPSRGNVDGMTYVPGTGFGHHCYISSFNLPNMGTLDPFFMELRTNDGSFVSKRTIQVQDQNPIVNLTLLDSNENMTSNIIADGTEYLRITVTDPDDDVADVYGDLTIKWPGQTGYTVPIDFSSSNLTGVALIPLIAEEAIDSGLLEIDVSVTGAHGLKGTSSLTSEISLSLPEVISIDLCRNGEIVDELMFGQTADAVVRIKSTRELVQATATLEQFGWVVSAPQQGIVSCGIDNPLQTDVYSFRIQLDSSFVPGEGSLGIRIVDIDDLTALSYLYFEFMHSPPEITVDQPQNVSHASLIEILLEMQDADGIDATCTATYYQNNTIMYYVPNSTVTDLDGTGFWSTSWLLPTTIEGEIELEIDCVDWSGNEVEYIGLITVEAIPDCIDNCSNIEDETVDATKSYTYQIIGGVAGLILVLFMTSMYARNKSRAGRSEDSWLMDTNTPEPTRDERIPEGWTLQEFLDWLDGPMPDDWTEEQWVLYKASMEDLR